MSDEKLQLEAELHVTRLRRILDEIDAVQDRSYFASRDVLEDLYLLFAVENAVLDVNQQAWASDDDLEEEVDGILARLVKRGYHREVPTADLNAEVLAELLEVGP